MEATTFGTRPIFHFARHYAEMVAVMFAGMGIGFVALLPFGAGDWSSDAPALSLLAMGASMTIPMVPWMRWRGHGWAACNEMAAAMIVPTLASVALLAAGLVTDIGTLMAIEHAAMFTAMLVVMLLRFDTQLTFRPSPRLRLRGRPGQVRDGG